MSPFSTSTSLNPRLSISGTFIVLTFSVGVVGVIVLCSTSGHFSTPISSDLHALSTRRQKLQIQKKIILSQNKQFHHPPFTAKTRSLFSALR